MSEKLSIGNRECPFGRPSLPEHTVYSLPSVRNINIRSLAVALILMAGSSAALTVKADDQSARTFVPLQQGTAEPTLKALLTQRKVVKSRDGAEKFEDASTVKPGDVIEYQVTYTNTGTKPVTGVVADLPIPDGLAYLPLSAKPGDSRVKAATKDGIFSPEPLSRTVAGKTEKIPYGEYRKIRWSLGPLAGHAGATVTARAQVETVIPALPLPQPKQVSEHGMNLNPALR